MKKIFILFFLVSFFVTCSHNLSGTNDETVIRTGAIIYEPDGKTPSVGATVKVFKAGATDGQYASKMTTDKNGKYSPTGLSTGTYNIWAEKDSFVAFQDSVFISDSQSMLRDDTLKCPSSLTGIVGVQPQHDPRTITIQVVGTDKYFNNTDLFGRFIMKGMASGNYSLLLKSTLPDYTPTTREVTVRTCSNDSLKDTLWLIYTGIPVVTGISATYDTLNGLVHLTWNKSNYRDLQSFVIYKDFYESVNLSVNPIAARNDTVFIDTIFQRQLSSGLFSFSDTNDYHFKYRVAIRNNTGAIGQTYRYADITAASPTKAKTTFSFSIYHIAKGFKTDSARINDSLLYAVNVSNPTRCIKKITWIDSTGSIVHVATPDSMQKTVNDSLKVVWKSLGQKILVCKALDNDGIEWIDTLRIQIVLVNPTIQITTTTSNVSINDSIKLHAIAADKFGKIVTWEWDIGSTGIFKSASGKDTSVMPLPVVNNPMLCVLRVTDDDGNKAYDTVGITIGPKLKWTYDLGSSSCGPAIGPDGTIYISGNGKLIALDTSGTKKWEKDISGKSISVGDDKTIYVGSNDSSLYAINSYGSVKWRFPIISNMFSEPAISADGRIYLIAQIVYGQEIPDSCLIYSISPNGDLLWSYSSSNPFAPAPAITKAGSIIFMANLQLCVFDSNRVVNKFNYPPNSGGAMTSLCIDNDGEIYGDVFYTSFYAINSDKSLKWSLVPTNGESGPPVIDGDGTVYFAGCGFPNSFFHSVTQDGTMKWSYLVPNTSMVCGNSWPAISNDGTAFFCENKNLYAINPNGTNRWVFQTDGIIGSYATIGNDGTVYIFDGSKLYAVYYCNSPLAKSAWPMHGGGSQNMNRQN
jgi:hypothetical protein